MNSLHAPALLLHTHNETLYHNFHHSNIRFFIVSNRWRRPSGLPVCTAPGVAQDSCLFACACAPRTIYPPSHSVGCGNVKEQSATDAITLPYSLQHSRMQGRRHTHTHTLINAPLPSPVFGE